MEVTGDPDLELCTMFLRYVFSYTTNGVLLGTLQFSYPNIQLSEVYLMMKL